MPEIVLALRSCLSLVFFVAGLSKFLGGLASSRKSLSDFGVPKLAVPSASVALPIVELTIALLLIPAFSSQIAALSGLGLLVVFNIAIAANLVLGRRPQCNCFGQLHSKPIGWATFGRNCVLVAAAGWVAWEMPRQPGISLVQLIEKLSPKETAAMSVALILFVGVAVEGFLLLHVLRQNGRLLLRIEALETRTPIPQPQMQSRPTMHGLPIGTKAIPFQLPKVEGGKASLDDFLNAERPVLLISTDPNCGPCNSLMPDVADWQKSLSTQITIVLLSHGKHRDNKSKVAEYALQNVLLEKEYEIASKYHAVGTPTAVLIRADGSVGSPAVGGADAIRTIVTSKAWTEAGFAAFMQGLGHPVPTPAPKPLVPVGAKAPDFTLPDLEGNSVNSASFNGSGTVLLFWNPLCGFCQRMLPQLKEWEAQKGESAPRLMLVSTGPEAANRAMGLESTILIDDKFAVGRLYGANGTPSAVKVDGHGKMEAAVVVGAPGVLELLNGKVMVPNIAPVAMPVSKLARAAKQN